MKKENTLISSLPLEELCEMYDNAWILKLAKQRNPYLFMWKMDALEDDMDILFEAMENKIPPTHQWEIEAIKKGLTAPEHNIHPGQKYRFIRMMWNTLSIQVVEEKEDNQWRCRMYFNGTYLNSVYIKTHTILTHYQLMP